MALTISLSESLLPLSDKCVFPPSVLAETLESHNPLPHPLIFRLESSSKSVLVGVKEFTAPEGTILVPKSVYDNIGDDLVQYHVADVPRATFLQVKPTQFYPHITNWKYYLESFLSKNYTTLSKKQSFGVFDTVANVQVDLQVEDANEALVVVVDTDIALDVVPLNDIMAAQQLTHEKSIEHLENVPEFGSGSLLGADFGVELQPFTMMLVPAIHKVDLRKFSKFAITITAEDMANVDLLAGLDKFVSLESFNWCTMDQDQSSHIDSKCIEIDASSDLVANYIQKHSDSPCWLYVVPFAWEHACKVQVLVEDRTLKNEEREGRYNEISMQNEDNLPSLSDVSSGSSASASGDSVQCKNCGTLIEKQKVPLHEAFCFRNNVRCSCGEVFRKPIPSTHWHCDTCVPLVVGNSSLFKFKHDKLFHQGPYVCEKCDKDTEYPNYILLVENHKATDCAAKLHECIFCHLVVPQEEATYQDRFANLSHHENQCGNKTTECYQCGRVVKNKDLASHMKIHYLNKVESAAETVVRCTNENCTAVFINGSSPTNELGLCESCFGPLYAQVHDPTHIKLQNRLERKYVMQLTKGCGNSWCENRECASQRQWDIALALKHIHGELLPEIVLPPLPINVKREQKSESQDRNRLWLCLNASGAARRSLYDKISQEGHYSDNMVLKAVAQRDEAEARAWLQTHWVV